MDLKINSIFKLIVEKNAVLNNKPWQRVIRHTNGTAFAIKYENKICLLTNYHCISDSLSIVAISQNHNFFCEVIRFHSEWDLALLSILSDLSNKNSDKSDIQPLIFGEVITGEEIIIQGYPMLENNLNITRGVLSKFTKVQNENNKQLCFQTDAMFAGGSSGSPAMRYTNSENGNKYDVIGIAYAGRDYNATFNFLIPFFIIQHFLANKPIFNYLGSWQKIQTKYFEHFLPKYKEKPPTDTFILLNNENKPLYDVCGLKIEDGRVRLADLYKKLGYSSRPTELISFYYCYSLLSDFKDEFSVKTTPYISREIILEYYIFGGYVFVYTGGNLIKIELILENEYNAETIKIFENGTITAKWSDFKKELGRKKISIFKLTDGRYFYVNNSEKKYTVRTKKLLGLF
jgi:hypothetical protein